MPARRWRGNSDTMLLSFTADWCGPCRLMQPTIQRLHDAGYPIREVNIDRNPDLASQFTVRPIPCFILVRDGREVDRVVGEVSYDRLVQMFEQPVARGIARLSLAAPRDANHRSQSPDDGSAPRVPLPPLETRSRDLAGPPPPPAAIPPSQQVAAPAGNSAQQIALQATVRLRVVDATGVSHGTGTIIDVHGDDALVLTCGHIFRDSQGRGEIYVELFVPGATQPVRGQLLTYEAPETTVARRPVASSSRGIAGRSRRRTCEYSSWRGGPTCPSGFPRLSAAAWRTGVQRRLRPRRRSIGTGDDDLDDRPLSRSTEYRDFWTPRGRSQWRRSVYGRRSHHRRLQCRGYPRGSRHLCGPRHHSFRIEVD